MNNRDFQIILQSYSSASHIPSVSKIRSWVNHISDKFFNKSVTIRIVDELESKEMNMRFRSINKPTNVLAFPSSDLPYIQLDEPLSLGDLVVCAPLLEKEALDQGKELESHWAHILIHGILHLIGYNHEDSSEANIMENLEIQVLKKIGFRNPYL